MSKAWLYAALALPSARWWWPAFQALLSDLHRAGAPFASVHVGVRPRSRQAPAAVSAEARMPLNRVLAFRGVALRVTARRRWQGGFGRRGL